MILIHLLANLVTRQRWLTGAMIILATVLAGVGFVQPPRSASPSDDKSPENTGARLRVATDDFDQRGADCFLVVQVDDLFQPEAVAALRQVVASLEDLPYIESVMWVDTVPVLNVFGLREPLLPPPDASAERFDDARQRAMNHPLVRGQLLSEDGRTLLMPVTFDWFFVTSNEDCSTELLQAARRTADYWPGVPITIRLTGRVPLFLAHQEAFDRNQFKFQVIAYALVFVLALILFRGIRAVLICAAAPALGVFWTLGLLNWLDELSNPLTNVVLPVLLTMVGLTDGVHLMVHIRRMRAGGATPVEAAYSAVQHVGLACALTSLTTAIGFTSLLLAHSEFVQGFGRACAIGVLVTFTAVVTFIPLMSSTWIGRHIHEGHEHDLVGRGMRRFGGVMDGVIGRARLIGVVAILSTLGFALVAGTLRPDDKMADSQPTGSEAYQALAHCDRALGGIEFVRVIVEWPEGTTSDAPEILAAVQDVERVLDGEDSMRHPLSILNILGSLPGDELVTSRLPFIELLPSSVKGAYFNTDTRRALVTVRIQDLGIARYEPVFRRVEDRLKQLETKYAGFGFQLTGDPVTRGRNLYRIVVDLAMSLGTASIIIFIVMTLVYRSLRLGLITLVPNLFPLVVTASMMVLLGHPLEIASVCAFTVCLGIAVDDTIHFLTRYQHEIASGREMDDALRRTFVGVGSAMIITTMILITGFGTVLTSDLPGHRYFAAMAVSTIAAALVGDLIFLPALLVWFTRGSKQRKVRGQKDDRKPESPRACLGEASPTT